MIIDGEVNRRMNPIDANKVIEAELGRCLDALEGHTDTDVIGLSATVTFGSDDAVREAVERRKEEGGRKAATIPVRASEEVDDCPSKRMASQI